MVIILIKGIGTDIVDISRIKPENLDRLAKKVLSDSEYSIFGEISLAKRKIEFFAGRFAVKEAFFKSMGTGVRKFSMKDVEVLNDELGAPLIHISEVIKKYYEIENSFVHVSISHDGQYAVSFVLVEEPG